MGSGLYSTGVERLLGGGSGVIDWATADVRVLLVRSGYTYNPDHDFVADLTPGSNEMSVSGYARQTCTGEARTRDDTLNAVKFTVAAVTFPAMVAGETYVAAVYFVHTGDDATAQLIFYQDLNDTATNGNGLLVTPATDGLFYIPMS